MLVLVVTCGIFSCSMWDLVPGIEPRPPVLGAQSLSHWTTREVPKMVSIIPNLEKTEAQTRLSPSGLLTQLCRAYMGASWSSSAWPQVLSPNEMRSNPGSTSFSVGASCLGSLCLSFCIYKIGAMKALPPRIMKMRYAQTCSLLQPVSLLKTYIRSHHSSTQSLS